ncbi:MULTISPECIES: glycoside hydrolase family 30 beta sandwich domain-containing protein [Paenibacillus]|uniref:glycoside hydrolase family 30 protein n=1 Tax=Paenibacillus TaxID=44249 RepID=UPI00043275E9|nr:MULTISPECIES: glycoside hydrolase family 30 beta sandwich domain-containing protein [Paenibacillus]KKC48988.1 glucan endo-1,6-beta-glucosidase [Paenibacillus sp. D9]CDN44004.1 Endo-1,6-beta-D-glucanase [Paenibacillus sp. P22]
MTAWKKKTASVVLAAALVAAGGSYAPQPAKAAGEQVEVWISTSDPNSEPAVGLSPSARLTRIGDKNFSGSAGSADYTITVNEGTTYQQMDGFGVSLTDSSAWLLNYKLDANKRAEVMEKLFGNTGIGLSVLRQPMGSSDFTWSAYTYADTAGDTALNNFSISRDQSYIIPMIKAAQAKNPGIKVFASPWSAPAWMKYSGTLNGGKLKAEYYGTYAEYFKKYIQAYQGQGIPIYAVTVQNEPLYEPTHYPSMGMNTQDEIGFIGDYLGPTLKNAGINTKIIAFDHNYLDWGFPNTVITSLKNAGKGSYVSGSAFHHYDSGDGSQMTSMHNAHPDKDVWFTEGGFGNWNDPQNGTSQGFDTMMNEFINITRNWSKSIILWNAALDQKDGPSLLGDNNSNKGMITIQNSDNNNARPENTVTYKKQYYLLGHFSKFVVPGAYRISTNTGSEIKDVAFKNPDGSKVVVAYNSSTSARNVKIQWGSQSFNVTIPAKSAMTYKWYGTAS